MSERPAPGLTRRARTHIERTCDVLVIGAGVAGVCAAIQAARLGSSVILAEMDAVLGGNSGPNLGIHVSGAHSFHPYAGETGIIDELEAHAAAHGAKTCSYGMHYNISRLWEAELATALDQAGVTVLKRHYAREPIMEGDRIAGVMLEDLGAYATCEIHVRHVVVDASGDGQIAFLAGADYARGREGKDVYGERSAPDQSDNETLGTSITALVRKASAPVSFAPPPGTPSFEPGYGFGGYDDQGDCLYAHSSWHPDAEQCFLWHTESGGERDTIADEHAIYEELLRQLYSVWNHIKNEAHAEEARNWELVWVSPKAGRRESRRFVGDLVLTQTDVEAGRAFHDAVAYGGYAVDIHHPAGKDLRQAEVQFCSVPPLYSIPFRCLYSRNVPNLLLAGRHVSVSHLALGTVRLQRTLGGVGQAVGVAADLCRRHACCPRDVYGHHVDELQQTLLREDGTILNVPNADATDLARVAQVTASSEERHGPHRLTDWTPLDRVVGVMLWDWDERVDAARLYLRNEGDVDRVVRLELKRYAPDRAYKLPHETRVVLDDEPSNRMEWGNMPDVGAYARVAEAEAVVPASHEGWVSFAFDGVALEPKDPTSDEACYALLADACDGVAWGRDSWRYDYVRRCALDAGTAAFQIWPDAQLFALEPAPLYGEAVNVVNGWNRRFSTNPVNMWLSDVDQPLPQWIALQWEEPQRFDVVQITFDTMRRGYRKMPINTVEMGASGMCVRDYDLEVHEVGAADGEEWHPVHAERGNYLRHRVHRLPEIQETDGLRLVVRATNEIGWQVRIYEVRVYLES